MGIRFETNPASLNWPNTQTSQCHFKQPVIKYICAHINLAKDAGALGLYVTWEADMLRKVSVSAQAWDTELGVPKDLNAYRRDAQTSANPPPPTKNRRGGGAGTKRTLMTANAYPLRPIIPGGAQQMDAWTSS